MDICKSASRILFWWLYNAADDSVADFDEDDDDEEYEEAVCKAKMFTRLFHLDSGSYWAATAVQALKGNIRREVIMMRMMTILKMIMAICS